MLTGPGDVGAGEAYVFGDVDPESAVMRMIEEKRVNGVPGHLFFADPEPVRVIRFHFAVPDTVLDEVCARMRSRR